MIFAIATKSSVHLYDTQQQMPFGMISNIHYARLTDLTWSADGTILIVSSVDGFCTLISFEENELGTVYTKKVGSPVPEGKGKENVTVSKESLEPKLIEIRRKPRVVSPKNEQKVSKIIVDEDKVMEIPESIIGTTESFESPEMKGTPVTPIAFRREPRSNPQTPLATSAPKATPKSQAASKVTPIAVRRQPRNILPSPAPVSKAAAEEEALDAWPIPIDNSDKPTAEDKPKCVEAMDFEKTEDMRLVYDGDSDSDVNAADKVERPENASVPEKKKAEDDPNATPDSSKAKTPRRVQLRTISTPKSKKKLL